jgi:drug/metabolite transporter (DMT)-like permease
LFVGHDRSVRSSGTVICLASASAFGAMGVLGKLAYDAGATVGTLLAVRFGLAALVFWALMVATRAIGELRALARRDVLIALGLGALGYAAQAGAYFAALARMEAGLLSLLVYTYPAIVALAAIALGRDRFDARRLAALVLASSGLVLVLASAGTGDLDPLATALGLAAAVVYSAYILVSGSIAERVPTRVFSTLVCSGAAVTLTVGSALLGELRLGDVSGAGWGWLTCLALVSTVAAISLLFVGIARVGPTVASILSTVEPVVTVMLAFVVFGEVLGAAQVLGGVLVLGSVLVLYARPPAGQPAYATT